MSHRCLAPKCSEGLHRGPHPGSRFRVLLLWVPPSPSSLVTPAQPGYYATYLIIYCNLYYIQRHWQNPYRSENV
jgi:hypothetical protein